MALSVDGATRQADGSADSISTQGESGAIGWVGALGPIGVGTLAKLDVIHLRILPMERVRISRSRHEALERQP